MRLFDIHYVVLFKIDFLINFSNVYCDFQSFSPEKFFFDIFNSEISIILTFLDQTLMLAG